MKRIISIILSVCFMCLLCVSSFAYEYKEGELFKLELPEEYTQGEEGVFTSSDNSVFSISYEDNTELGYSVKDLSEGKLREMAEYMAEQAGDVFASMGKNAGMELVSLEKIKHQNGMSAVVSVFKTTAVSDDETVVKYQKVYEFGGEKNKYTFTYTTSDENKIDDMDSAFSSIVIYDKDLSDLSDNIISCIVLVGLLVLIVFGIAKFLRKPKKK